MRHRINKIRPAILALAISALVPAGTAGGGETQNELELSLYLVDGSCVIGTPVETDGLEIRTKFATVSIPLNRIGRATREEGGEEWIFELQNGDRPKGVPVLARIELETLFGRVAVATGHITEIGVGVASAFDSISKRGFVLHYPFEGKGEKIEDRSGEENHAVNHGAKRAPKGVLGNALSLDGRSSYLDLGSGSIAGLPSWESYTISVWFLNDGGGDQNRGYGQKIIDKTIMYHDFYLCLRSNGALAFFTYEESGEGLQDADHDYRDGKWHHAVVVKRGSHGELWVDGRLKDSNDNLKQVNTNGPLLVGYSNSSDGFQKKHWSGLLDELLILKRPLVPRDIAKLFAIRDQR